jgi:hypothetical protein
MECCAQSGNELPWHEGSKSVLPTDLPFQLFILAPLPHNGSFKIKQTKQTVQ